MNPWRTIRKLRALLAAIEAERQTEREEREQVRAALDTFFGPREGPVHDW